MPARTEDRRSYVGPLALGARGRRLFCSSNARNDAAGTSTGTSGTKHQPISTCKERDTHLQMPSDPIASAAVKGKPRSATISMPPNSRKPSSPLLPSGWFNNSSTNKIVDNERCSAGQPNVYDIPSLPRERGGLLSPRAEGTPLSENRPCSPLPVQPPPQLEKLQRRRRSFFFKKRKGLVPDGSADGSGNEPPPLPSPNTLRTPTVSAKQMEERRIQNEINLAALERVSDLVCLATEESADACFTAGADASLSVGAPSMTARTLASNSSHVSLASAGFNDCEVRLRSPSSGYSYAHSSDTSWQSDGADSIGHYTPSKQSVMDQVLLPSSMKSIKRERRRLRPAVFATADDPLTFPASTRACIATTDPMGYGPRASLDERRRDDSPDTLWNLLYSPLRSEMLGPAPPLRPGRARSQRPRANSLTIPRSFHDPSLPSALPDLPEPSYRPKLSTISSSSSEELARNCVESCISLTHSGPRYPTRPRREEPVACTREEASPFSTPTFGHECVWPPSS